VNKDKQRFEAMDAFEPAVFKKYLCLSPFTPALAGGARVMVN
jgi:hypothetical protein